MSTKLIALVVIAAGIVGIDVPEIPPGQEFVVEDPDLAGELLTAGKARLAAAPLTTESRPSATPTPAAVKSGQRVKVRLLVDSAFGNANDLAELDAEEAKSAVASGIADKSKAAIEYAAGLEQNQP